MASDVGAHLEAAEPYRPFRPGMEVEPAAFTPPEVRPGLQQWERYRLLMAEGRARAGFAIFLFPMVPLSPLLLRAMRDLWGWEA